MQGLSTWIVSARILRGGNGCHVYVTKPRRIARESRIYLYRFAVNLMLYHISGQTAFGQTIPALGRYYNATNSTRAMWTVSNLSSISVQQQGISYCDEFRVPRGSVVVHTMPLLTSRSAHDILRLASWPTFVMRYQ
jgi:hypothetical protein